TYQIQKINCCSRYCQIKLNHKEVLPQHYVSEKEDLSYHQKNSRVTKKEPGPPQIKVEKEEPELPQTEEEWEEPEPSQMKEEQEELCISQDEDYLQFKQETNTFMDTFTYEDNEHNVLDLKNQQGFNGRGVLAEDGNQHVQNVDAVSQSDSDVGKISSISTLIKKSIQSFKEKRLSFMNSCKSSRTVSNMYVYKRTESDERSCVCKECGKSFKYLSKLRLHMRVHTGEKPFFCKLCDTRFGQTSSLKRHMMIHTGEKPFSIY
uniref:C2H2-type domain-containing protein n=1 Tax=Oryzias melastigma TaxID=30732 RepID=A0A3B3DLP3_ORYME